MAWKCDKCGKVFETHDGGTIKDDVSYCPKCAEEYGAYDDDDDFGLDFEDRFDA
jgi:predicted  nucleic acid-binding Zn-ribbon protein